MSDQSFHWEQLKLELTVIVRFLLLCVPVLMTTGLAVWVFSVEDSAIVWRVVTALGAGMFWYLLIRHLVASASAWNTLELSIWHWSRDCDIERVLRLGVGNQSDDRVQVVQPERVLPVQKGGALTYRTVGGFSVVDLSHFVMRSFELGRFGTSQRNWIGQKLPSGMVIETIEQWRDLQQVFGRAGLLINVGIERECAQWAVHDPVVVRDTLNLPAVSVVADSV